MIVREATGGTTTQIYFQYDLTEVFIDSISWGGAAGGGKPSESLSVSVRFDSGHLFAAGFHWQTGCEDADGLERDHERAI